MDRELFAGRVKGLRRIRIENRFLPFLDQWPNHFYHRISVLFDHESNGFSATIGASVR